MAQRLKRLPSMWETWVRSQGREDPLEKEMVTHSSVLAWKSQGQRSLAGYSPWGHKRVEQDLMTQRKHGWRIGEGRGKRGRRRGRRGPGKGEAKPVKNMFLEFNILLKAWCLWKRVALLTLSLLHLFGLSLCPDHCRLSKLLFNWTSETVHIHCDHVISKEYY